MTRRSPTIDISSCGLVIRLLTSVYGVLYHTHLANLIRIVDVRSKISCTATSKCNSTGHWWDAKTSCRDDPGTGTSRDALGRVNALPSVRFLCDIYVMKALPLAKIQR